LQQQGVAPPDTAVRTSPDGNTDAYVQNYNIYLRARGARSGTPLSYDGSEGSPYTLQSLRWSPDSKKIAVYKVTPGYQRIVRYVISSPVDQLQPSYMERVYRKPGDVVPVNEPVLFDVATARQFKIDNALFPNPYQLLTIQWKRDSRAFTFEHNQRGHQVYRVIEVNAATGVARSVISEESKTFIDYRTATENNNPVNTDMSSYVFGFDVFAQPTKDIILTDTTGVQATCICHRITALLDTLYICMGRLGRLITLGIGRPACVITVGRLGPGADFAVKVTVTGTKIL